MLIRLCNGSVPSGANVVVLMGGLWVKCWFLFLEDALTNSYKYNNVIITRRPTSDDQCYGVSKCGRINALSRINSYTRSTWSTWFTTRTYRHGTLCALYGSRTWDCYYNTHIKLQNHREPWNWYDAFTQTTALSNIHTSQAGQRRSGAYKRSIRAKNTSYSLSEDSSVVYG